MILLRKCLKIMCTNFDEDQTRRSGKKQLKMAEMCFKNDKNNSIPLAGNLRQVDKGKSHLNMQNYLKTQSYFLFGTLAFILQFSISKSF